MPFNLSTHEFEPAFPKRDRTGLELRTSLLLIALGISGKESIVTKRVAHGEVTVGLGAADDIVFDLSGGMWNSRNGEFIGKIWEWL